VIMPYLQMRTPPAAICPLMEDEMQRKKALPMTDAEALDS
jgi:hypothetical protein